eukprot:CAMPEP_0116871174 /NCGR_PEP_ID=MMETSP0463-20121206/1410_1 /TAXON_ID=181622 /ORGANISM="Strombidinopsis sp, Strain SopsisLIS2011" /LENGTH=32 /DNA_ID= /DNA_START= /DNA_END= /DNA_ORIENTATION=
MEGKSGDLKDSGAQFRITSQRLEQITAMRRRK